tara:strand:+ start:207 stop:380 length:174 start_codon:yes stop_codon:yes gene_type:complete
MKEYWSTITVKFGGNNLECESEEDYIKQVKENFYEEYGLDLRDEEIEVEDEEIEVEK